MYTPRHDDYSVCTYVYTLCTQTTWLVTTAVVVTDLCSNCVTKRRVRERTLLLGSAIELTGV